MRDSIISRIQTASAEFKTVAGIADLNVLLGERKRASRNLQNLPGAFPYLAGESASDAKQLGSTFRQTVTSRWGVMLVTRSRNDAEGHSAADQTDQLISSLDAALLGWTPEGACRQMRKARNAGQLRKWAADLYFYSAIYEAEKRIVITGGN